MLTVLFLPRAVLLTVLVLSMITNHDWTPLLTFGSTRVEFLNSGVKHSNVTGWSAIADGAGR